MFLAIPIINDNISKKIIYWIILSIQMFWIYGELPEDNTCKLASNIFFELLQLICSRKSLDPIKEQWKTLALIKYSNKDIHLKPPEAIF